jgi:hypothetical protein
MVFRFHFRFISQPIEKHISSMKILLGLRAFGAEPVREYREQHKKRFYLV